MPSGIYKHKPLSEETKQKLRGKRAGGWKVSNETKRRISENNARYWLGKKRLSLTGEKHYRYIKDRTQLKETREKAYDTKYKYWMRNVKNRDNWSCRIADVNCDGRLEAHHILNWKEYPELRYQVNNGITLCHAHHPRKRSEEAKLSPYFQKLVAEGK